VLESKTRAALLQSGAARLVIAGGVACNSGVRTTMACLASELGIELHIPRPSLCGDNAAMLAVPGNYYLERGLLSAADLDVTANWEMDRIKEMFCE
jgi:N6-L-threonylcarbamoyladenine synthase